MNIKGNDENKNSLSIREDDIFKKAIMRGFHCVGEIFIFTGKLENRPERSLLCNGGSLSIPTSEEDPYWELYQVIGTIYNENNTPSDQFCVPNLFEDNGRFIRAALSNDELGKTQIDEIRNIISFIRLNGNRHNIQYYGGGIRGSNTPMDWAAIGEDFIAADNLKECVSHIEFNANSNHNSSLTSSYTYNPMAGHANGRDIHPANIKMYYLIAY